ncbi:unnamed protein product [Notodromas monacha]|uniref:Uncharacterized protein n=1 Tax=Notodromas monacha TaxID=399045 RepID=A0A7R9GEH9_9CRUS|nr:unnamed protein product [Notodromas monacha]CAG0918081.1 unnamed protein product [Notodromas monacha]
MRHIRPSTTQKITSPTNEEDSGVESDCLCHILQTDLHQWIPHDKTDKPLDDVMMGNYLRQALEIMQLSTSGVNNLGFMPVWPQPLPPPSPPQFAAEELQIQCRHQSLPSPSFRSWQKQ